MTATGEHGAGREHTQKDTAMDDPIEAAARAMCVAEGVDPDLICWGVTERGKAIGETYPAWRYRTPLLKTAIAAYLRAEAEQQGPNAKFYLHTIADDLDQDPG